VGPNSNCSKLFTEKNEKVINMKTSYKLGLGVGIGGLLGFSYYFFIGCQTGACPLTSNPFISTGYGAVLGLLMTSGKSSKEKEAK
jgi:hypothetical protein